MQQKLSWLAQAHGRQDKLASQKACHPRERGDPEAGRCEGRSEKLVIQIVPIRIESFDQLKLPRSPPFLDAFFAVDRCMDVLVNLKPDEAMNTVALGKAFDDIILVSADPIQELACETGIKRPVSAARHYVHEILPISVHRPQ